MLKQISRFTIVAAIMALSAGVLLANQARSGSSALPANPGTASKNSVESRQIEHTPRIEVGPFDIHKKYRSMEGPYVIHKFALKQLVASDLVKIPESMISYLDQPGGKAPSMDGANAESSGTPSGLVDLPDSAAASELLWFRGIKLEVLDENDKPLPSAEFICHMNLDVDQVTRFMAFPELERRGFQRLITLTQGQTEFHFPEGYAVPVSSDEEWKFTFQAANRTTNKHRRIKHLCTLNFVRDSELTGPLKALYWYNPYISVELKSAKDAAPPHAGPACMQFSRGDNAPNMVPGSSFKDSRGIMMSPHWTVSPGRHVYSIPATASEDEHFAREDCVIHAGWAHVHPACTEVSLIECNAKRDRKILDMGASTLFKSGPELSHIDTIYSQQGIMLRAGKNYKLSASYENPTNSDLDSMVALGIFCESKTFVKPDWLDKSQESAAKSEPAANSTNSSTNGSAGKSNSSSCDLFCGIKNNAKK